VRVVFVVMGVLLVALLGLSVATGGWSSASSASAGERLAPVRVIAARVETLRGLRYRHVPAAVGVTPAQARRDGLADFDRSYPVARQRVDETMLRMLGLLPARLTLRDVDASLYGQGVAGYYDPRTKRLRVVDGAATGTRVLAETVLAHELTHALEDQRYGLSDVSDSSSPDSDAALAKVAMVEGTATTVMTRYMTRYFSPEEALGGALASAFADTGSMPPFLESQSLFPYTAGEAFVGDLLARAGGSWSLVDTAERFRPPASTEQVLHPALYLSADEPRRVRLGGVGRVLGSGWSVAGGGTWGEFQTRALLTQAGGGDVDAAAAGWGGDRWELWRSSSSSSSVLVMRWVWDTPRDLREFVPRLRAWVVDGRGSRPAGEAAAVAVRDGAVTLALALDPALAERVAAAR
jgi:hypothetical protein